MEPILREFLPPVFAYDLNCRDEKLQETASICHDELNLLISLSPEWQSWTSSVTGRNHLRTQVIEYTWLRYFGFDEFADTFIENFLIEPGYANMYISLVAKLILYPIGDPLKSNLSISLDTLQSASQMGINTSGTSKRFSFPKVGSDLMKKCNIILKVWEACKNVISRYEENDLYKINTALNDAIVDENDALILQKNDELGEILDNVWTDSSIKKECDIMQIWHRYYLWNDWIRSWWYAPVLWGSVGLGAQIKQNQSILINFQN